jgi:hypothetical protein
MRSGTVSWPGYRRSPIRQLSGLDARDEPCSGKDAEDGITGEHGYYYTEDDSDTDQDSNQQPVARQIRSRHLVLPPAMARALAAISRRYARLLRSRWHRVWLLRQGLSFLSCTITLADWGL